jgi:hypothetical protein
MMPGPPDAAECALAAQLVAGRPPPLNCQKSCSSAVVEHRMDVVSWHASAVKVAQQDVRINFHRGGGARDAACAEHVACSSLLICC